MFGTHGVFHLPCAIVFFVSVKCVLQGLCVAQTIKNVVGRFLVDIDEGIPLLLL